MLKIISKVDNSVKKDLKGYIVGRTDFKRKSYIPLIKNLHKKDLKDKLDEYQAKKAFFNLINKGAKEWFKYFGDNQWNSWRDYFPVELRKALAEEMYQDFVNDKPDIIPEPKEKIISLSK